MPGLDLFRALLLLGGALLAMGLLVVVLVSPDSDEDLTETIRPREPVDVPPRIAIVGNLLVDADGEPVQLVGVSRSGTEYACAKQLGLSDGPFDDELLSAMEKWGVNTVRVPLNEHCWLGLESIAPSLRGETYRNEITRIVDLVGAKGMFVILDLHFSLNGQGPAVDQDNMANRDHSITFWASVAKELGERPHVLFELYNEPHDIDWTCWRDGCDDGNYAGMQELVDAVRSSGSPQPVIVNGLEWSNDLSRWLELAPTDPRGALVAGFHLYDFNRCDRASCWAETVGEVADVVPVITTELGQSDCRSDFVETFMTWADKRGVSYLGWAWNEWDCEVGPALVVDDDGTPTDYGEGVRAHMSGRWLTDEATAPVPANGGATR